MGFVGNIQKLIAEQVPWWLRGQNAGGFLQAGALTLDNAYESYRQGLMLSQPLRCDTSALPIISDNRRIRIYSTEPEASKRYRLSRWWQLHRQFGTHIGQGNNIAPLFLPATTTIRFVHQSGDGSIANWWTRSPAGVWSLHQQSPSNWNFDNVTWKVVAHVSTTSNGGVNPAVITTATPHGLVTGQTVRIAGVVGSSDVNGDWKVTVTGASTFTIPVTSNPANYSSGGTVAINMWSRYWCIIYRPSTFGAVPHWDDGGNWDDPGRLWDGLPNTEQIADIVAGLKEAGEPSSMLWGVAICNDPTKLDPSGTSAVLGDGSTTYPVGNWGFAIDNVTGLPTRPNYLSFIYDKGQA